MRNGLRQPNEKDRRAGRSIGEASPCHPTARRLAARLQLYSDRLADPMRALLTQSGLRASRGES